mmetsp:Transcript_8735/g.21414  ORF Transcript_8735/g.21414 Transcript_8735/m.21414 type:complete len:207 (-) Transcript_8735:7-627(-)
MRRISVGFSISLVETRFMACSKKYSGWLSFSPSRSSFPSDSSSFCSIFCFLFFSLVSDVFDLDSDSVAPLAFFFVFSGVALLSVSSMPLPSPFLLLLPRFDFFSFSFCPFPSLCQCHPRKPMIPVAFGFHLRHLRCSCAPRCDSNPSIFRVALISFSSLPAFIAFTIRIIILGMVAACFLFDSVSTIARRLSLPFCLALYPLRYSV